MCIKTFFLPPSTPTLPYWYHPSNNPHHRRKLWNIVPGPAKKSLDFPRCFNQGRDHLWIYGDFWTPCGPWRVKRPDNWGKGRRNDYIKPQKKRMMHAAWWICETIFFWNMRLTNDIPKKSKKLGQLPWFWGFNSRCTTWEARQKSIPNHPSFGNTFINTNSVCNRNPSLCKRYTLNSKHPKTFTSKNPTFVKTHTASSPIQKSPNMFGSQGAWQNSTWMSWGHQQKLVVRMKEF